MKKIIILILIFAAASSAYTDTLDNSLNTAFRTFSAKSGNLKNVSVGMLVLSGHNFSTPFSEFLSARVSAAVAKSAKFTLISEESRQDAMDEMMISLSGMAAEPDELSELALIDLVIQGSFVKADKNVDISLQLISMKDSSVKAVSDFSIPVQEVPESIRILPENYNEALDVIDKLVAVQESAGNELEIVCWTTKGTSAIYHDGEKMTVNFIASRDCFIKMYHIDVNGNMQVIFPNEFYGDNKIKAKQIYRIPDAGYPFEFILGKPYGVEFIKVAASTVQFNKYEESFSDLGKVDKRKLTRGLTVKGKDKLYAETLTSYTICK